MPSTLRVRSTASTIFFLPSFDRWDRPTAASKRTSGVHPGRLAQGPDEKSGRAGRMFGFIKPLPYRRAALRWGSVARGVYTDGRGRRQYSATPQLVIGAGCGIAEDRLRLVVVVQHPVDR